MVDRLDYDRDNHKVYPRDDELDCISLMGDIDVSVYVRKRTKRIYIGGFKPFITLEKLMKYVKSKGLVVTWVNIWARKRNGRVVIRLNVETSDQYKRITEPGFWPRGIDYRPCISKNSYNHSYRNPGHSKEYETEHDFQYTGDNEYAY